MSSFDVMSHGEISHSRPCIGDSEVGAVLTRLAGGMIANGAEVAAFERDLARMCSEPHGSALAVSSGTHALYVSLAILGVGRGDRVALPSYSCRALADAVVAHGAEPVILDVGPDFRVESTAVQELARTGRLAALVVVHPFGLRVALAQFAALDIPIIEDAAHAFPVERTADVTIFSFHATKLVTAGEGGAVLTRRDELRERLEEWRQGRTRSGEFRGRLLNPMSDLAAALVRTQLERKDEFARRRLELAARYRAGLGGEVTVPFAGSEIPFRFLLRTHHPGVVRRRLAQHGVAARRPYDPLLHHVLRLPVGEFPVAQALYNSTLSIPLYPALTDDEAEYVLAAVGEALD